jgi:Peptidase family M1 domain
MPVLAALRFSRCLQLAVLVATVITAAPSHVSGRARSQQPSDTGALLGRIQAALIAGSAQDFLALGTLDPDAKDVRVFLDRWFVRGTTAAELRERDRLPVKGGSGVAVVVEALVEAGPQGRLATWRLDLAHSDAGWQITGATTLSAVEGLYRLSLNQARQFKAHDLVVKAEDLELRLPDGYVFVAEAAGRTTAAVLVGRGEMIFKPSPATEQQQIKLFAGHEELKTPFSNAFIRLNPSDGTSRLASAALSPATADAKTFARASAVFAEQLPKSFGLDLADLSRESWSLVPAIGDFLAEIDTRRFGTLTYTQSANDPEDITVFDRSKRRNISVYASKARVAAQGTTFDEDASTEYDVQDVQVDTTFSPERLWIDGQTKLRLKIRSYALTALTLRLAEALVVRSVVSEEYGRLLALRVRGQNSIVVNLPEPAVRDAVLTLMVTYAGRLVPQGVDRENVTVLGQEYTGTLAVTEPEPSYIYSNRSYWYAQAPVTDYATATIRFTVPPAFTTACSGEPAQGSPVMLRPTGTDGDPRKLHVFATTKPVRYLACVTSRFVAMEPRPASASAPSDQRDRQVSLRLLSTARQRGRARDALTKAADIIDFYISVMGEAPYQSLTLAVVEANIPGGHSPGYLVILNQPLPTTPFVWRDDPAAFDDFPDFFIAHELAHQWWGQAVGWKNYHEQWLSEGIAQYFAALYAEHQRGPQVFGGLLRDLAEWSLQTSDQGPVYLGYRLGHVKGDGRIFRALVYNKGASVLHMLRRMLGDEVFFRALRRFYKENHFAKAGTNDLRKAFEQESGRSLEGFFDRWIMGQDLPTLVASHTVSEDGTAVTVRLEQPASHVFEFPVTVSLVYADGSSDEVTAVVNEAQLTKTLPLKKKLRSVEVNRDRITPVRVVRK